MLLDVNLFKAGLEPTAGQHPGIQAAGAAPCGEGSRGVQAAGTHISTEN